MNANFLYLSSDPSSKSCRIIWKYRNNSQRNFEQYDSSNHEHQYFANRFHAWHGIHGVSSISNLKPRFTRSHEYMDRERRTGRKRTLPSMRYNLGESPVLQGGAMHRSSGVRNTTFKFIISHQPTASLFWARHLKNVRCHSIPPHTSEIKQRQIVTKALKEVGLSLKSGGLPRRQQEPGRRLQRSERPSQRSRRQLRLSGKQRTWSWEIPL